MATSTRRSAPAPEVPNAMRSGIKSASVRELQVILRDRGLYDGRLDGYYGNRMRISVYKLQQQLGVTPTGHFTAETVEALRSDTGEVPSDESESSSTSPTTPRTAESDPGSARTGTSEPSSKPATKSTSSSSRKSSRTSSKASGSSGASRRTSGG